MCTVATYVKVVSKYCGRVFGCDLKVYFSLLMQQKRVNYSFLIRVLLLLHFSTAACDTDMKSDCVPGEERVLLGITH